eukprot:10529468-Karenia_brevis.AAC.1
MEEVEEAGGGGWRRVKENVGIALAQELHEALGLPYPSTKAEDRVGDDWPEERAKWQATVDVFLAGFVSGRVVNVLKQSR